MIYDMTCKVHGLLTEAQIARVKRKNRPSMDIRCRLCNKEKQRLIREKKKEEYKDFNGICKVEGCVTPVKYVEYMLCGIHRYRWEKYKSYDPVPINKLPENIVKKCKKHGFLTINEVDIDSGFYKCSLCRRENKKNNSKKSYSKMQSLKKYMLTLEDYEALLEKQNSVCAICKKPETMKTDRFVGKERNLAVDHCHATLKVRGLLCGRCNNMIGYAKDSPEILRSGADYLEN